MQTNPLPEVWLRGSLPDIPALLQPVAHALLQAREELTGMLTGFPERLLWQKPAGMASAGFHLQHLTGVLDRLFTYARGEALTTTQLEILMSEGKLVGGFDLISLIAGFNRQVDRSLDQLRQTDETMLTEVRSVGRAQLPSTVIGLYVHAAEHTMRHIGQLLVTVRCLPLIRL